MSSTQEMVVPTNIAVTTTTLIGRILLSSTLMHDKKNLKSLLI